MAKNRHKNTLSEIESVLIKTLIFLTNLITYTVYCKDEYSQ